MLKVWGRKTSSNVQALMWCIGELGLPFERYDIGHKYGGNDTPEFLAMNPNGLVPVLKDNDGPALFETGAILRYLSEQYATAPFWPDDIVQRSQVDMWAEWAKLNISLSFTGPIFWKIVRTAEKDRDPVAITAAIRHLTRLLQIAETRLAQHDYLVGNAFTLADIQLGYMLYRYYDIDIERADLPALQRYYQRLTQRPAYREHVMISYEELRVV
ncbi:glutathione S-transferase family protein [Erwiniaceae bacterium BAC15a-03b]|uniref:Glutathione S-transferase family protein n=1 Tax=Winslowiella arboricola TaxID=2978220 RepID=A0A9J6PK29_9GAMM|nr:glutathione S-transferase family protein [Winslowiella arboricola]MCU5773820.1 glutathione S-transferase family protein [Winslowiella arboricola]MCU5777730.1 glutathione S-transferase family protein [Winslowiella arboricola]